MGGGVEFREGYEGGRVASCWGGGFLRVGGDVNVVGCGVGEIVRGGWG